MKRNSVFLSFFMLFLLAYPYSSVFCNFSEKEVVYEISFNNAVHHEAEIKATFSDLSSNPLEIVMSQSSPGYYISLAFAKNVYNVKAYNSKGEELKIIQPNEHEWKISEHDGTVRFTYTLFADHMDGTHSSITSEHCYINIPYSFVWARGLESKPIRLKIKKPVSEHKIVTQLIPSKISDEFTAPDLAYFIDSPFQIADFDIKEWDVESNGKTQKIRLAVNHNSTNEAVEIYSKMVEALIHEQKALFTELPDFDYGTYTFITNYIPEAHYDGMEHRNSSVLTSPKKLDTSLIKSLRTLSHELFHAWECERIKPEKLVPFDLEKTNMSDELWFVEGFPTYYQDLTVKRAALVNLDEFGEILKARVNYVFNYPGNNYHSLVEMSRKAPFFNGGVYEDAINKDNIYISYYSYGAVIALGLDLTLRTEFKDITLDDYLREIWKKFGKTEKPFTNDDLKKLLSELTKDDKFAEDFFNKYIYGNKLPDINKLLSYAGLVLRKKNSGKASLGRLNILNFEDNKALISSATLINEPLYSAGLDNGDIILQLDSTNITKIEDLEAVLDKHKPGDIVNIDFKRRNGQKVSAEIIFEEDKELEIVPYEVTSLEINPEIIAFRKSWLDTKTNFKNPDLVKKDPETERVFPLEFSYCPYTGRKLKIALKSKSEIKEKYVEKIDAK